MGWSCFGDGTQVRARAPPRCNYRCKTILFVQVFSVTIVKDFSTITSVMSQLKCAIGICIKLLYDLGSDLFMKLLDQC